MSLYRKGQLSRADLLDALASAEGGAVEYVTRQLGLEKQPEVSIESFCEVRISTKGTINARTDSSEFKLAADVGIKPSAGFWLLQKREATEQQTGSEEIAEPPPVAWSMQTAELPVYHPLTTPRSLLSRLLHHLKHQRDSREIDVDAMLKKIGRGEHLITLPKTKRRGIGRHLHIIDDRQLHLTPYWCDQGLFTRLIESLLPDYASSRAVLQNGRPWPVSFKRLAPTDWELPPEGSVVVVFSDLGALATQPERLVGTWRNIARTLSKRGCKLIAITPCHPNECDPRLKPAFIIEPWETRQHIKPNTPIQRFAQAEHLLTLLAPAIRLEPGLLRSVRIALARHGVNMDASVEAVVWQHPSMQEHSSVAATFNAEMRKQWLDQFRSLDGDLRDKVLTIMRTWRTGLQQQVWMEEITSLDEDSRCFIPPADIAAANRYFQQLISRSDSGCVLTVDVETRLWLRRLEKRLQPAACSLPKLGPVLQEIIAQIHKHEPTYHTDHLLDPAVLAPVNAPEQTVLLYQQGEQLAIGPMPAVETGLAGYSRLASIRYRRALFYIELEGQGGRSFLFQPDRQQARVVCALPDITRLMIRSDVETLYFKQIQREPWMQQIGRDQYGLYADLDIKGITQRFRWIEPGTFLMGSPEYEAERYDGEVQHSVTLSQGYWLADTAVTHALCLALIGYIPRSFSDDPNNPVEGVSCDGAQVFIAKLNKLMPGINAELPSEALWEYACRAGTTTPFSFGENITTELVNYDGNYPYAGAGKGLYRGKTVAVKSLPANPWGLYGMHGNVWEWCMDYWTERLPQEPVTDPAGPTTGTGRVVRGGSWGDNGGSVRSASRAGSDAGDYDEYLGFRLALGLELKLGQVEQVRVGASFMDKLKFWKSK